MSPPEAASGGRPASRAAQMHRAGALAASRVHRKRIVSNSCCSQEQLIDEGYSFIQPSNGYMRILSASRSSQKRGAGNYCYDISSNPYSSHRRSPNSTSNSCGVSIGILYFAASSSATLGQAVEIAASTPRFSSLSGSMLSR
jgi:hypothetical protein